MTILHKLHAIEKAKSIYNIHYCLAGVGFIFYEPPEDFEIETGNDRWRKYLTVETYWPTFEDAVKAEYKKLK